MRRTRQILADTVKAQAIDLLDVRLAAAIDLHGQIRHARWNVRGRGCRLAHDLFDEIAFAIAGHCDAMAERARVLGGMVLGGVDLGGMAHGTIEIAAQHSVRPSYPPGIASQQPHMRAVADILADFDAALQRAIHQAEAIGDGVTADLFAEISRGIDQQLWLVESRIAWQMIQRPARVTRASAILAFAT